jgi:micrococcal nuclease
VDGDTLVIDRGLGEERLRYIGVDAPESVKPGSPVEFMGKEASAANAALVEGATVALERDVSETDQYGRLLRYVWLREGDGWLLVNLELVRQGYASAVTYPPDVRWAGDFRDAERVARDAGLGLWGAATPVP